MKIGILTYDLPHDKTQKVLKGLIAKKFKKIKIIFTPFKKYKKKHLPLIKHRPNQFIGKSARYFAKKFNLETTEISRKNAFSGLDYVLVCGSGIIEKNFIKKNFIINCHPGLIPQTRGLDSFKWAIFNNFKVGNTLHFIDSKIDQGRIITQKLTKLAKSDTILTFAKRHYLEEINLLINFDFYLQNKNIFKLKKQKSKLRMPKNLEKKIILKFNNRKKKIKL
jgi:phosphoribosylglycinamide formyltransferase-1